MDAIAPAGRVLGEDGGQALIVSVLLLAIAAVVIVGLRSTQMQILAFASERSAGEAAVEAATTVIADAYADELGARAVRSPRPMSEVLADPGTRERARSAAAEVSARNGGPAIDEVTVICHDGAVDVATMAAGVRFAARFPGPECFPH